MARLHLVGIVMLSLAAWARGQLTGSSIVVTQLFEGPQATGTKGIHTYGIGPPGATIFEDPGAPEQTWTGLSPASPPIPGFDNSFVCDYTDFHAGLLPFAGTSTSLMINTITVPAAPFSVHLFNSAGVEIGQGGVLVTMLIIEVPIDDIRSGPTPTMVVAWDNAGSPCYPDCNNDGVLTIGDFGCFQGAFAAGDPYADCNRTGTLTIADFACFQAEFAAGCP
jgi:hypothetical protein